VRPLGAGGRRLGSFLSEQPEVTVTVQLYIIAVRGARPIFGRMTGLNRTGMIVLPDFNNPTPNQLR